MYIFIHLYRAVFKMECFSLTFHTIQLRVPQLVALFWHEGLFLATVDRNSLTTWANWLEITEILSTDRFYPLVAGGHQSWNLSSCPMKSTSICNGGKKRRWILSVSWNLLGHSQSANLKGEPYRTGNRMLASHFISPHPSRTSALLSLSVT